MTKRSSTEVSKAYGLPSPADHERWKTVLALVDYKPGWAFNLLDQRNPHGVLAVEFKMLVWDTFADRDLSPIVVTTNYEIPNALCGDQFSYSTALDWLRGRIHAIEMHEADEWFRFDGMQCFNPHGQSQQLGRRPEGWEWMSPPALSIAPHLQEKPHGPKNS